MSLRLAGGANGVSMLHGAVSRAMFAGLWPDVPMEEVPIGSVTNGVHGPTWVASEQAELLTTHVGSDWAQLEPSGWSGVSDIPDSELWRVRRARCERLVAYVRRRARTAALRRGVRESEARWCDQLLNPDALTIGFARRFATYKRATLLLRDPVRLRALLLDENRPVQLVFAGKAHPGRRAGEGVHTAGRDVCRRSRCPGPHRLRRGLRHRRRPHVDAGSRPVAQHATASDGSVRYERA